MLAAATRDIIPALNPEAYIAPKEKRKNNTSDTRTTFFKATVSLSYLFLFSKKEERAQYPSLPFIGNRFMAPRNMLDSMKYSRYGELLNASAGENKRAVKPFAAAPERYTTVSCICESSPVVTIRAPKGITSMRFILPP